MKGRYPERRQHVRIITLRNFAWFVLASVLVLAAINVMSELRAPHANDYGRILNKQIVASPEPSTTQTAEVAPVEEGASVGSENLVDQPMDPPVVTQQPRLDAAAWQTRASAAPLEPVTTTRASGDKVAIVGDESGVAVVTPKHKLRGGWFRP